MKKTIIRALAILLALFTLFAVNTVATSAASVNLTERETQLLANMRTYYAEADVKFRQAINNGVPFFDVEPVYDRLPLSAGTPNTGIWEGAVAFLNAVRAGAGFGALTHSPDLTNRAQHKAVLSTYYNNYYQGGEDTGSGHYLKQVAGIPNEFFELAMGNMGAENLYYSSIFGGSNIVASMINAMNDAYDAPRYGHRWNLLSPNWTEIGLGIANGQGCHRPAGSRNYDGTILAWPFEGVTLWEAFSGAWSINFLKGYSITTSTAVTVKSLNDNRVWTFSPDNYETSGNRISFYNSELNAICQPSTVFEITLNNLTGAASSYTYRAVIASGEEGTTTTYRLTVNGGTGTGDYTAGTSVPISADPAPTGKVFDKWTVTGGGTIANVNSANTTFIMSTGVATVTATYKKASPEEQADNYIPGTQWRATPLNLFLYYVCFGWIWMRFVPPR